MNVPTTLTHVLQIRRRDCHDRCVPHLQGAVCFAQCIACQNGVGHSDRITRTEPRHCQSVTRHRPRVPLVSNLPTTYFRPVCPAVASALERLIVVGTVECPRPRSPKIVARVCRQRDRSVNQVRRGLRNACGGLIQSVADAARPPSVQWGVRNDLGLAEQLRARQVERLRREQCNKHRLGVTLEVTEER